MSLARNKTGRAKGARERILEKAQELFYTQGFQNTGINQIIEESGTAKASFYQYFKSKDELGIAYLEYFAERVVNTMHRLMDKYPTVEGFFRAWTKIMNRDVLYDKNFNGCPFANFAAQLERDDNGPIAERVDKILTGMYQHLVEYFKKAEKAGQLPQGKDPELLARRIMHIYEGSMTMARLTKDLQYVRDLEQMYMQFIYN